jgi:hypothetical protein
MYRSILRIKSPLVLKQAEDGTAIGEVWRKIGISEATLQLCKKHAGLMPSEMKRLRQLCISGAPTITSFT